ncbi:PREDICTED: MLP-like protein 328 [Camelina sativa]|uniref:MLP-like protein 328 n=1 Tax=Camelina sativa TaxID=90675 RepID=A0ABM0X4F8_CAMSA|nr:PREDICTED: MLP-like protein 328 [Camelina sativa]
MLVGLFQYVTDVPLKGSAEKHYKRWKSENHLVPDAIGHLIHGITLHEGEWDSPGAIKSWKYNLDGKEEVFKERIEMDDEKMAVTFNVLDGQVMEELKVYIANLQFIPESGNDGCVCKVSVYWEKRTEDSAEPTMFMKFLEKMVADMDGHILQNQE